MDFILKLIAMPLGFIMWGAYSLVSNYGIAIILFTIITKVLLFPLSIKQQKSSAKMALISPEMKKIQKKYAKDRVKMNEELMKLYEEHDYNQMAGCLPLLIQMPILFGLYEVIRNPLTHVLRLPNDVLQKGLEVANGLSQTPLDPYTYQTGIKVAVDQNAVAFNGVFSPEQIANIQSFDLSFFGLDLTQIPTFAWNIMLIIPIISVSSMMISQLISMKLSGQLETTGKGMILPMVGLSTLMTGYFSFAFPAGVSLYWITGNIIQIIQSFALNKIYNPKKLREEQELKLKEKKKQKEKQVRKVVVVEEDDKKIEKKLSDKEYYKLRMEKARKLDEEKYRDEEPKQEEEVKQEDEITVKEDTTENKKIENKKAENKKAENKKAKNKTEEDNGKV